LRDSYIHLNLIERKELMAYYVKLLPQNHPYLEATKELSDDFDLITIQRKLKDAGRFQYINTVKKNPKFLPYISNSLAYVSEALERQKQFEPLTQLLSKYLKEFERKT